MNITVLSSLTRPIINSTFRTTTRSYGLYGAPNWKPPTMDEVPVPFGSWQELHDKRQKRYNTVLAIGVISLVTTIIVAKQTGTIYLNAGPPTRKE